jgi:hypothetical protein
MSALRRLVGVKRKCCERHQFDAPDPSRKQGVHRNNHHTHAEFFAETVEKFLSQNLQRKATYRLAYSLYVDARQETDMPLLAFPA